MNPLSVLRDSLYFFRRNLASIIQLCLPLVVLESVCKQLIDQAIGAETSPAYDVLVGLLFYPLYTAALILFLDARSRGHEPQKRDLLATALRLWPTFALLAAMSTLLIMLGVSLFVLPGMWVMIKLVFAEYLLVLRGLTPLAAMRESFQLSQGHFWRILVCILSVLAPLWLLDGLSMMVYPEPQTPALALVLDSVSSFLQLFTSVVLFRLFMLIAEPVAGSPAQ
ncbi:YciC family protein [Pseudomonas akapageensis]|uniref:YciC family protein n=1 Tax=Pseudomonas akapageensis TaxID=2609961 RepID=UPI00140A5B59|nr:YciC family protein [Pseudomonas akapageensis]